MRVLVTGGAGYVGSVLVAKLIESGHEVNVLDDLSTGHRDAVHKNATFYNGSILDNKELKVSMNDCDVVFHLAAKTLVAESVANPDLYMEVNLRGTENVLKTMHELKINKFVMASTCAVYSASNKPLNEESEIGPTSPYGESKLLADNLITMLTEKFKLSSYSFRFFNAAGAYYSRDLGWLKERHNPETHLIPNLIKSKQDVRFKLFGTDWDTADGTCIRDYVHVSDIAEACIKALSAFTPNFHEIINLGSNTGVSVKEIIHVFEEIQKTKLIFEVYGRRDGDSAILVADSSKALKILNWKTKFDSRMIIQTCLEIDPSNA
jgi:UDP-glucose 4-epimerase